MSGEFVHLHNHSDYSLLDGAMKTRAMVAKAAADGQPALALTDHGNLFGAVEFYLECRKKGLRPILGMEAYVTRDRHDRSGKDAARNHHTVLLARNRRGWQNLIRLATAGFLEGFYYKPRIDKALLAAHSEGLVALSACLGGEPNSLLQTRRRGGRDARRGRVPGDLRAGELLSSRSRTMACRRRPRSAAWCPRSRARPACRSSPPTTATSSNASTSRRTTSCWRSRPARP